MAVWLRYTLVPPGLIRLEYGSDLPDPTFYIWVDGELETETKETAYELSAAPGGQAQISVFDDPDEVPPVHVPANWILRWDGDPESALYRVERETEADVWTPVDVVPANDLRVFHYTTPVLADSTVHRYRVVPIDSLGREGTVLEFEAEMCRYPDDPRVALSIGDGEITISEV